jgi:hypothetical protein
MNAPQGKLLGFDGLQWPLTRLVAPTARATGSRRLTLGVISWHGLACGQPSDRS